MYLHMAAQIPSVVEIFTTNITRGGELLCPLMDRHVVFVISQLRKGLVALVTPVPGPG